jgi:hypothetical protein
MILIIPVVESYSNREEILFERKFWSIICDEIQTIAHLRESRILTCCHLCTPCHQKCEDGNVDQKSAKPSESCIVCVVTFEVQKVSLPEAVECFEDVR